VYLYFFNVALLKSAGAPQKSRRGHSVDVVYNFINLYICTVMRAALLYLQHELAIATIVYTCLFIIALSMQRKKFHNLHTQLNATTNMKKKQSRFELFA